LCRILELESSEISGAFMGHYYESFPCIICPKLQFLCVDMQLLGRRNSENSYVFTVNFDFFHQKINLIGKCSMPQKCTKCIKIGQNVHNLITNTPKNLVIAYFLIILLLPLSVPSEVNMQLPSTFAA
jgi:hypothetical protein